MRKRIALLLATLAAVIVPSLAVVAAPSPPAASQVLSTTTNPHGPLKDECEVCHRSDAWKPARISSRFDHARSGFALEGAHKSAACTACHTTPQFTQAPSACLACHEDPHRGEMGTACGQCHSTASFVDRGMMTRRHAQTRFPLTGSHAAVDCDMCHKPAAQGQLQFVGTATSCGACHAAQFAAAKDHVARGYPQSCETCHTTMHWDGATFDHANTGFVLTGKHEAAACGACHSGGVFAGTPSTCQACHSADYAAAAHPPHTPAAFPAAECASCHTTAQWSGAAFDHGRTAFALTGKHQDAACQACHSDGVYAGKSSACQSCHQADYDRATPRHTADGMPPQACATCHSTTTWAGAPFDHTRTQFPLTGKHTDAACQACHTDGVYAGTSTACDACHAADYARATPPHTPAAMPSSACATCHTTAGWAGAPFDHSRTQFALTGAHIAAACQACHADGAYAGKSTACQACHESDFTRATNPPHTPTAMPPAECASCHSTASWAGAPFDHTRTAFPLTGGHVAAACQACHGDGVYATKSTACDACHMADYNRAAPDHRAAGYASSACASCHTTTNWLGASFDHNTTQFPLTGAHTSADCQACHADNVFAGKPTACESCHQADYDGATNPPHTTTAMPPAECASCHTTSTWDGASFDHSRTQYPLTGSHTAAACQACHADGVYAGKSTACDACHMTDYTNAEPNHQAAGYASNICETCHTTTTWSRGPFDHSTTQFALTGAHVTAACLACHADGVYAGKPTACDACHMADYDRATPDHRAAGYGSSACASCHTTTSWSGATFDHNTTQFPLTGAHTSAACQACHADNVFAGKSTACESCHQADYDGATNPPHTSTAMPPAECASCHTTSTWDGASFDHSRTQYPLTGSHTAAACQACHADGVYAGKSTACDACHMTDYTNAEPNHQAAGYASNICETCHTTTTWSRGPFDHSTTQFALTGAHVTAACLACHADGVYAGKPTACDACHMADYDRATPDHRAAGYGSSACASCHTTTSWSGATFDHNATQFPLTGAHTSAACQACHADNVFAGKSTACESCHQADYDGATNPPHTATSMPPAECASCHTTSTWDGASFDHSRTQYPLTGAHTSAACQACHADGVYAGKPTACDACHMTDYTNAEPNHQAAGYASSICETCHTTTTWSRGPFDHSTTQFALTGAHVATACLACHADGVYAGKPTACDACHLSTYASASPSHTAAGFASSACAACHTTTAWTGGVYDHNATQFPLTGAHTSAACQACHADNVFAGKPTACDACHMDDYNRATPNHAAAGYASSACASCHTTTTWSGAVFDHNTTQFPLTGAHTGADCQACHADNVFDGKSTACQSCHQADYDGATDPPHTATAMPPAECASCHTTASWDGASFDHTRTTFALTGAHTATACQACHADGVYAGKSTACDACHMTDYTNATPNHTAAGYPSSLCATCHTTTTWAGGTFDHNTTQFPLTGAHVAADCMACHADNVYDGKSTACDACHMTDYTNATPNHTAAGFASNACATCHTTTTWTGGVYDHNTTQFPLTGAHTSTACQACHADNVFAGKSTACDACHMDDYNAAQPDHRAAGYASSACAQCHTTTTWAGAVFDHNTTQFPLTGAHVTADCMACHADNVYDGKSTACDACHMTDYTNATPNHTAAGFASSACASCHTTTAWSGGLYDHNTTQFPLTGAHTSADCQACHADNVFAGKSTACDACHMSDYTSASLDHTAAGFASSACASCHTTTTWAGGTFDHNLTSFPLTGSHVSVDCLACHADQVYDGKSTDCQACHIDDYNTATPNHQANGWLASACTSCHNTTTWSDATFNHDRDWFPIYSGAHQGKWSSCMQCHQDVTTYLSYTCLSCHPHDNKAQTDANHSQVSGYRYDSTYCYACHPRGKA